MKKFFKLKNIELSTLLSKKLRGFSNYLHHYGNEQGLIIIFSDNSNEAEVDAFLNEISDEVLEAEFAKDQEEENFKVKRREAYNSSGLLMDRFVEMLIEDDQDGIQKFREDRMAIKQRIPKPVK